MNEAEQKALVIKLIVLVTLLVIPALAIAMFWRDLVRAVQASEFWQQHWGDVASIVGVAIAWIGFTWTILLTTESRSAARQARAAAEEARNRVYHFDAVVDLTQAQTTLKHIMQHHRNQEWDHLPARHAEVRSLLVSLKAPGSSLSESQRTRTSGVLAQLNAIDDKVEKALHSGKDTGPARAFTLLKILKDQDDHLSDVLAELRQGRKE